MAISDEVMTIVRILNEEGFGVLAGELLAEISRGRDLRKIAPDDADVGSADYDELSPIPEEEQLPMAMDILRRRLVAPARALADGEALLGKLFDRAPVRIRFVDVDSGEDRLARQRDDNPDFPLGRASPGDRSVADKLDAVLSRIESPEAQA